MWAAIFEAGSTHIWEVLETEEGGGHMAPVGMQLIHSLWTLAHTKGPTNHMSWRVRAWGYPAASRAVDIVQSNSVFWGKSADPRSLGSFQCFWATNVFLHSLLTGQLSVGCQNCVSVKPSTASPSPSSELSSWKARSQLSRPSNENSGTKVGLASVSEHNANPLATPPGFPSWLSEHTLSLLCLEPT